jgi:LPXTG-motif cell wall-anchored protein
VDLTDDEIDNNQGQFVYRLYPPVSSSSTPYEDIPNQIPSRGFIIRKASEVAASSASAAASQSASRSRAAEASKSEAAAASSTTGSVATTTHTGTQTGSASTIVPTNAAQNTGGVVDPTPTPSSGLSTGAKAGIAIAVVALALIAAVAIFLLLRRRRRQTPNPKAMAELSANTAAHENKTMYAHHGGNDAPQYQHQGYASPPSEMEAPMQYQHAHELPGSQAGKP